ncbi:fido domain-containing protein [Ochromonadaceae sp. CCMP2298]|nr:fido domain-containing protein [Ochromonadaceae sp. CCMP2298]
MQSFSKTTETAARVELLELHAILLQHTLAENVLCGSFRRFEIAVTGCPYEFPLATEVPELMRAFLQWLNDSARDMHPVVFATEAHLRFVTIHPFEDGNGRMSRLIMCLVLMRRGYVPIIINPACNPEYKGFVKHYQVTKMNPHTGNVGDIEKLLKLVANELLGALDLITDEAQAQAQAQAQEQTALAGDAAV